MVLYGVASGSRLLKITGLFCKRALYERAYSAKETCVLHATSHTCECVNMVWLWLVGSIKLQVSFAKEPYVRESLIGLLGLFCRIFCKRDLCSCAKEPYVREVLQNILQKRPMFCMPLVTHVM